MSPTYTHPQGSCTCTHSNTHAHVFQHTRIALCLLRMSTGNCHRYPLTDTHSLPEFKEAQCTYTATGRSQIPQKSPTNLWPHMALRLSPPSLGTFLPPQAPSHCHSHTFSIIISQSGFFGYTRTTHTYWTIECTCACKHVRATKFVQAATRQRPA